VLIDGRLATQFQVDHRADDRHRSAHEQRQRRVLSEVFRVDAFQCDLDAGKKIL
jgi:hypothetical protein